MSVSQLRIGLLALAATIVLSGCAGSKEMLVPVRGPVPQGVDFTGEWRMQEDFAAMQEAIASAVRRTDGIDERQLLKNIMSGSSTSRRSRDVGGLVHVFLENAARLRVTQTDAGLFMAFDRSVVEEYRFGEARIVNKGGAVAQRVSGWDGETYVIETLDQEGGMKLSERYSLEGEMLNREIVLRSKELEEVRLTQSFARTN